MKTGPCGGQQEIPGTRFTLQIRFHQWRKLVQSANIVVLSCFFSKLLKILSLSGRAVYPCSGFIFAFMNLFKIGSNFMTAQHDSRLLQCSVIGKCSSEFKLQMHWLLYSEYQNSIRKTNKYGWNASHSFSSHSAANDHYSKQISALSCRVTNGKNRLVDNEKRSKKLKS